MNPRVVRRILVTGIHGFFSGEVARAATQEGDHVIGLGRRKAPSEDCTTYVQADCVRDDLQTLVREHRPDAVVHGAGSGTIRTGIEDPSADFDASVLSFQRVLEAVRREAPGATVVFPSSASVYGQPESLPVAESAPRRPISAYGHHKAICEALAREYHDCFGVSVSCLRIFSTFGFRQRKLLVWELAREAIGQGEVVVRGTGDEERDYLPIDDVVRVALSLLGRAESHIVNVASGTAITIRDVAEAVARGAQIERPVRFLGQVLPGNPTSWRADTRLLHSLVSLTPRDTVAEIADLTREWAKSGLVESRP